MVAKLLAQNLSLLGKSHLRVLLGRLDYLVHSLKTLLDLLHESALALKTQPLVLLKLVQILEQHLLHLRFYVRLFNLTQLLILFHFSLNLSEYSFDYIVRLVCLSHRHLEISLFLLVCKLDHLHVGVPLFFESLDHIRLNAVKVLLKCLSLPHCLLA